MHREKLFRYKIIFFDNMTFQVVMNSLFFFSFFPQYSVSDLEGFVRGFNDMTVMVLDGSTLQYQGVSTEKFISGIKTKLTREAGY